MYVHIKWLLGVKTEEDGHAFSHVTRHATKFLNGEMYRENQFTAIPLRNLQGKHTIGKLFGSRLRIHLQPHSSLCA